MGNGVPPSPLLHGTHHTTSHIERPISHTPRPTPHAPRHIPHLMSGIPCPQVTLLGVMTANKGTAVAPLLFPLICLTSLFWVYHEQQHFRCASFLPLEACVRLDRERRIGGMDFQAFVGAYEYKYLKEVDVHVDCSIAPEAVSAEAKDSNAVSDEI